jgi:hypothetical protein
MEGSPLREDLIESSSILKIIESAEEVPNIFARYLESENQADLGDCYRIITTSIKRYIELFISTSTSGNSSSKCASLTEKVKLPQS